MPIVAGRICRLPMSMRIKQCEGGISSSEQVDDVRHVPLHSPV